MRLLASSSCGGMQLLLLCMGLPLVSALPPIVDPGSSQPSNPSTLQQPDLPPSNASSLQASGLEFACLGGPNYGEDMAPQNCMNAAERLLSNIDVPYQRVLTFRDRRVSDRSQPADVWLPQVSVSYDGSCTFEIILRATQPRVFHGDATPGSIRNAAKKMVKACTSANGKVKGGLAINVDKTSVESPTGVSTGQSPTVGLRLARFNPSSIRCVGKSQPVAADCDQVLDAMPAVINPQIFGEAGWPGVEVGLPVEIHAEPRNRCTIIVNSFGGPLKERWYTLWRYAAAIKQLCVNYGRPGVAYLGAGAGEVDVEITY